MPVATAPWAARPSGRNGTNSNRGQMGSDDTISIVPSLAHRPIGLRGVVGEDASVMQD